VKEVESIGVGTSGQHGKLGEMGKAGLLGADTTYIHCTTLSDEEIGWATAGKRPEFKTGKNVSETAVKAPSAAGPDPNKVYTLAAGDGPSKGPKNAKVTVLHYFDYQCPFCVKVAPTLEQLLADYPNDVRVVYKMHPCRMHQNAMIAAEAARANAQEVPRDERAAARELPRSRATRSWRSPRTSGSTCRSSRRRSTRTRSRTPSTRTRSKRWTWAPRAPRRRSSTDGS
jgi:thiol-disulfide isomerase/thioredoxin